MVTNRAQQMSFLSTDDIEYEPRTPAPSPKIRFIPCPAIRITRLWATGRRKRSSI